MADITEQLPDLPETASKYNEQFLEEMDRTLDILPTWTTKLNALALQIQSVKDWMKDQIPFFNTVIEKANEIKGYVIPTGSTYSPSTIDAKIADVTNKHTFYIDQNLGNDTNDGSSAYPIKTLNEAFRRSTNNSLLTLEIVGVYNIGTTEIFTKERQSIEINIGDNAQLINECTDDGNYNWFGGITTYKDTSIQINLSSSDDDTKPAKIVQAALSNKDIAIKPTGQGMFRYKSDKDGVHSVAIHCLSLRNSDSRIEILGGRFFSRRNWNSRKTQSLINITVSGHYTGKLVVADGAYLAALDMQPASIFGFYPLSIVDADGNAKVAKDIISGVVINADGKVLNVISNIDFS